MAEHFGRLFDAAVPAHVGVQRLDELGVVFDVVVAQGSQDVVAESLVITGPAIGQDQLENADLVIQRLISINEAAVDGGVLAFPDCLPYLRQLVVRSTDADVQPLSLL